jgi:acyl-CoA thioesterase-1
MPPNLGKAYTDGFSANYAALAKAHGVTLLPFLLEPIALDRNAYQADNLHPTAAAQPKLRDHVWKALAPLLR